MLKDADDSELPLSSRADADGAHRLAALREALDRKTARYQEVDYQMQLADSEDIGILTFMRLSDERDLLAVELDRLDEQIAFAENRKPPRRTD